jgi:hypothetical protein
MAEISHMHEQNEGAFGFEKLDAFKESGYASTRPMSGIDQYDRNT